MRTAILAAAAALALAAGNAPAAEYESDRED